MTPPPAYSCCNDPVTLGIFSVLFPPFAIYALCCAKTNKQIMAEYLKNTVFDYSKDRRVVKEVNERLITELRAVWPGGFEVDKAWMTKAAWSLIRPWKLAHHCTYRSRHVKHYTKTRRNSDGSHTTTHHTHEYWKDWDKWRQSTNPRI